MADSIVNLTPDPFAVITAGLNVFGDIIRLTDTELALLNSPQMIQGRLNVAKQERKDEITKDADYALKSGNLENVDKDLS